MSVANWNKDNILKFSIDHKLVNDPLVDFPVLLNLSSSSGKNNFDCTDIFDKLTEGSGNDSYTELLVQSNTTDGSTIFYDNSQSNYPITPSGDVHHEEDYKKFGSTSIYFNNSDTGLLIPADVLPLTSTTFTIDSWIYTISSNSGVNANLIGDGEHIITTCYWSFGVLPDSKLSFRWYDGATHALITTNAVSLNTWVHVAVVVIDSSIYLFINGNLEPATGTNTLTNRLNGTGNTFIGMLGNTNFEGYVDDLRFSEGIARWTENFTPPSNAYTAEVNNNKKIAIVYPSVQEHWAEEFDVYTKLLIRSDTFDNDTSFTDSSENSYIITVTGNTHHETSQSKFGNSSIYFDGVGDYLSITDSTDFDFGAANFTLETQIRLHSNVNGTLFGKRPDNAQYAPFFCYYSVSAEAFVFLYSTSGTSWSSELTSTTVILNTWYHLAIVRNGDVITMYVDGISQGELAISTALVVNTVPVIIGGDTNANYLNGYIDELRISKGTARWTEDFTPPSSVYEKDSTLKTYIHNGQEQLFCEIERWDSLNKEAQLWVKVPKVLTDQPTDLLLYYDNTQEDNISYVNTSGAGVSWQVWDENFVAVYHMSQDPSTGGDCLLDSTSNINHGTPIGNLLPSSLVDGVIGKAIEFNGTSDYINIDNVLSESITNFSVEFTSKTEVIGDNHSSILFSVHNSDDDNLLRVANDTAIRVHDLTSASSFIGTTPINDNAWHNIVVTGNSTTAYLTVDSNIESEGVHSVVFTSSGKCSIAQEYDPTNITGDFFDGTVDYVRISNTVRSDSWIKTTYNSNNDNLISITQAAIYQTSGYVKERGEPVERLVCIYDRTTGELMDKTTSNILGYYTLRTTISGTHNLICMDALAAPDYDDLIISKVIPVETI